MTGKVEDWSLLTENLGLSSDCPALDSDESDLYTDLLGMPDQANFEESSGPCNNGAPDFDFSGFGIDPQLVCPVGAGTNIPAQIVSDQVVSDQGVAAVGSVDGSQVAIVAL